jgi:hypothetical protein
MGLINDRRPTDWAYKAVFKEKDLPSLEEMARHITETHDVTMIEDFNAKCEQKLKTGEAEINGIEIQQVTKTGDLVTNPGLQQCLNIILGTSSTRWTHIGSAGGTGSAAVTDTALVGESLLHRAPFAWNEPVGMRLYFGAISGQTDPAAGGPTPFAPNIVGEIGVYNGSAAGVILLNRSVFPAVAPFQDQAFFSDVVTSPIIISVVIEFCPVA